MKRSQSQIRLHIMAVLRRWDSIGVVSDKNQDAYDSYAANFVRLPARGATSIRWSITCVGSS